MGRKIVRKVTIFGVVAAGYFSGMAWPAADEFAVTSPTEVGLKSDPSNCLVGGAFKEVGEGSVRKVVLSPDKKWIVVPAEDSFVVLNVASGAMKSYENEVDSYPTFLKDGRIALIPDDREEVQGLPDRTFSVLDPATGVLRARPANEVRQLVPKNELEGYVPLRPGEFLTPQNSNLSAKGYRATSRDSRRKYGIQVLRSGNPVAKFEISGLHRLPSGFFTPDGSRLIMDVVKGVAVLNLTNGRSKWFGTRRRRRALAPAALAKSLSADGEWLAVPDFPVINVKTLTAGGLKNLDGSYIDTQGHLCGTQKGTGGGFDRHQCFLLARKEKSVDVPDLNYGSNMRHVGGGRFLFDIKSSRSGRKVLAFQPTDLCYESRSASICMDCGAGAGEQGNQVATNARLRQACNRSFSASNWDPLTPLAANGQVTEAQGLVWLHRFAKPGGFDPKNHLGLLVGLMKSPIRQKYPAESNAALIGVLHTSNALYESLLKKMPELRQLSESGPPDRSCLTDEELKLVQEGAFGLVERRLDEDNDSFIAEEIKALTPFIRGNLSDSQKNQVVELAGDRLTAVSVDTAELHAIFPSKIYKFAANKLKGDFGLPNANLTDLTTVRDGDRIGFHRLTSRPNGNASPTPAGFYIEKLDEVNVDDLPDGPSRKEFNWTYGGTNYRAAIDLKKAKPENLVESSAPGLDYDGIWKGGEMRGLVVIGTNMKRDAHKVFREYMKYYEKEGFRFASPAAVDNLNFIESRVGGPRPVHYLSEESHADGDEKHLFEINKRGFVSRGTRNLAGGRRETVDIVMPDLNSPPVFVSNASFGKWMQSRVAVDKSQLAYLSGSCWSTHKAVHKIAESGTPKLVVVATANAMDTFDNDRDNPVRLAIDGIRNRKSWANIRENLEVNPEYRSGTGNTWIFPDESEYRESILNVLNKPVLIRPEITYERKPGRWAAYTD